MIFPGPMFLPDPETLFPAPPPVNPPPQPAKKTSEASQNLGSLTPPEPGKTTASANPGNPWQAAVAEKTTATEKNTSFKAAPSDTGGSYENQGLFVLPPIAIPTSPGEAPAEVPLAITLKDRVLQLQATDARFGGLQLLVEENRVYLSGAAYQWNDVQKLAKAISRLPGVAHVIIGQVQIKAQK
jgi:hypothetical protein